MKYLNRYNESITPLEDIQQEIKDILIGLEDDGFSYNVSNYPLYIEINKYRPLTDNEKYYQHDDRLPFLYSQISDSTEHVISYLKSNGYRIADVDFILNYGIQRVIKGDYYLRRIVGKDYEKLENLPEVKYIKITFK